MLGCLLEKQRTVADQYPLTLNGLVAACNQSTAREPVMHVVEHDVETAVASLKAEGLLRFVHPSHGRTVTRYRQVIDERLELDAPCSALLALLLLRGPQTVAELLNRSARLHEFTSATDVEVGLTALADGGIVERLDRQTGQKENRWKQLVADEADVAPPQMTFTASAGALVAGDLAAGVLADRVSELEERVSRLEAALADLL